MDRKGASANNGPLYPGEDKSQPYENARPSCWWWTL